MAKESIVGKEGNHESILQDHIKAVKDSEEEVGGFVKPYIFGGSRPQLILSLCHELDDYQALFIGGNTFFYMESVWVEGVGHLTTDASKQGPKIRFSKGT